MRLQDSSPVLIAIKDKEHARAGRAVASGYSKLAQTYATRPDDAAAAIDALLAVVKLESGGAGCDIGVGSRHRTLSLLEYELLVDALSLNDAPDHAGEMVDRWAANPQFLNGLLTL